MLKNTKAREEKLEELKKLEKEGKVKLYSISKINTFAQCPFQYEETYIKGNRGEDNCYSIAGSETHDWLEAIHKGELDVNILPDKLEGTLMALELLGQSFPSKTIEDNWIADMTHFAKNFKPLDIKEIQTEELMLFEIKPNVWIRGYIDAIIKTNDDEIMVLDWKTSSMFSGKGLIEAGRQLLLYKKGLEIMEPDLKVDKVAWYMLKYSDAYYNGRSKVVRSGQWVKEREKFIYRELKEYGMSSEDIDLALDLALLSNSIVHLPQEVQDKFELKPHVKYYEVTDENMQELDEYLLSNIEKIDEHEADDYFPPLQINGGSRFFCENICSHRKTCPHIKQYLEIHGD